MPRDDGADPGAILSADDWAGVWFRERTGPRPKQRPPRVEVGPWHRVTGIEDGFRRPVAACLGPARSRTWPSGGLRWEVARPLAAWYGDTPDHYLPGAVCPRCLAAAPDVEREVAVAEVVVDPLDALVDRVLDRMRERAEAKIGGRRG